MSNFGNFCGGGGINPFIPLGCAPAGWQQRRQYRRNQASRATSDRCPSNEHREPYVERLVSRKSIASLTRRGGNRSRGASTISRDCIRRAATGSDVITQTSRIAACMHHTPGRHADKTRPYVYDIKHRSGRADGRRRRDVTACLSGRVQLFNSFTAAAVCRSNN